MLTHPYKETESAAHRDLQTMGLQQPPFSAACIPFKWMRREFADELAEGWRLDYDPAREPTEPSWLAEAGWVQDGRNQRAMLDGFFSTIKPELSLFFFTLNRRHSRMTADGYTFRQMTEHVSAPKLLRSSHAGIPPNKASDLTSTLTANIG
ncbi:hypothetical protein G2912_20905 [Paraburkholderia aspalathi]|nr:MULTISPECIES: hypothetical protein [Paraburkholderia]MBK3812819.1 hypothetical protein [Paraburkholderia aspalathi]